MYCPNFNISPYLLSLILKIDKLKNEIAALPVTPRVLKSLRESSMIRSSHYSTYIEGNKLTKEEVADLISGKRQSPRKERDEKEVLGYYAALENVQQLVSSDAELSEKALQHLHAIVMNGGKKAVTHSAYRDGQNVIKDSRSGAIVYLPPEAHDVPQLMSELVEWLKDAERNNTPAPLCAAIAHYQFATIHPYFDGNGRTSRLLTNWILHTNGYGLKGIYSLEEYYAHNLSAYYDAIAIGPSHNYYFGRAEADITPWIEYFCEGMLESFKNIKLHTEQAVLQGAQDTSQLLNTLTKPQQTLMVFFQHHGELTSRDVQFLFKLSERTARNWLKKWFDQGFIVVGNPSKIKRSYRLAKEYEELLSEPLRRPMDRF